MNCSAASEQGSSNDRSKQINDPQSMIFLSLFIQNLRIQHFQVKSERLFAGKPKQPASLRWFSSWKVALVGCRFNFLLRTWTVRSPDKTSWFWFYKWFEFPISRFTHPGFSARLKFSWKLIIVGLWAELITDVVMVPTQEHGDAAPEDVNPCFLLLQHHQTPLPEPMSPATLAPTVRLWDQVRHAHGDGGSWQTTAGGNLEWYRWWWNGGTGGVGGVWWKGRRLQWNWNGTDGKSNL